MRGLTSDPRSPKPLCDIGGYLMGLLKRSPVVGAFGRNTNTPTYFADFVQRWRTKRSRNVKLLSLATQSIVNSAKLILIKLYAGRRIGRTL